jgi:hypothetical protein
MNRPTLEVVEVSARVAPDGVVRVLLQLPQGYILVTPDDARHLASMLRHCAAVIDGAEPIDLGPVF